MDAEIKNRWLRMFFSVNLCLRLGNFWDGFTKRLTDFLRASAINRAKHFSNNAVSGTASSLDDGHEINSINQLQSEVAGIMSVMVVLTRSGYH